MNPLDHIQRLSVCDLCGADIARHGSPVAEGRQDLLGAAVPLSTVACGRCRFIFQPDRFSDALLAVLYERDTSFTVGEAEQDLPIVRAHLAERQAVISNALEERDIAEGAAILDVGGGRGECCLHLAQRYRVVVADATECNPADPRIEKVSGLFSEKVTEGAFDVVVMNHVLEHVFSPTQFLLTAWRALRVGGVLTVEVPFELFTPLVGKRLGDWRHVSYFCRATLRQFLEKTGFEVARIRLEEGCYGARRLPVIRAVALKRSPFPACTPPRNSPLALAADMLKPAVLLSLVTQRLVRQ